MSDPVIVAIIVSVPGMIAAILGFFNHNKLGEVSEKVDGRLTELLELTRKASKAEGAKEEKEAR